MVIITVMSIIVQKKLYDHFSGVQILWTTLIDDFFQKREGCLNNQWNCLIIRSMIMQLTHTLYTTSYYNYRPVHRLSKVNRRSATPI